MQPTLTTRDLERFWAKVDKTPTCWLWTGARSIGYGHFHLAGKKALTHRVSWLIANGSLPDGLVLDHACRVRHCVNPDHLRPLTNRNNILIGISPSAINSRKTHCPRGHEYSPENTYRWRNKRHCRACGRAAAKKKADRS